LFNQFIGIEHGELSAFRIVAERKQLGAGGLERCQCLMPRGIVTLHHSANIAMEADFWSHFSSFERTASTIPCYNFAQRFAGHMASARLLAQAETPEPSPMTMKRFLSDMMPLLILCSILALLIAAYVEHLPVTWMMFALNGAGIVLALFQALEFRLD
jgi:hypothetical protein